MRVGPVPPEGVEPRNLGAGAMITRLAPDLLLQSHDWRLKLIHMRIHKRRTAMATKMKNRAGKIKYGILGWLIGLPLPIVLILLFYRGCDF
jgi:hypothetical protein